MATTKVRFTCGHYHPTVIEERLYEFLTPQYSVNSHAAGRLEGLSDDLMVTNTAIGKLLALLVEKEVMSLPEAQEVAGHNTWHYGGNISNVELVKDDSGY